jgi:uncharacterized membrane protein
MLQKLQRFFRHRWHDQATLHRALPPAAFARLTQRVQRSEQKHSGEIRIFIEAGLPAVDLWRSEPLAQIIRQRALQQFAALRVWDTEHNNGVLIYLLMAEHAIEIVADRNVKQHVTPAQWQAMIDRMVQAFRASRFEDGLSHALDEITEVLAQHFPLVPGESNPNELPDAPVLGES